MPWGALSGMAEASNVSDKCQQYSRLSLHHANTSLQTRMEDLMHRALTASRESERVNTATCFSPCMWVTIYLSIYLWVYTHFMTLKGRVLKVTKELEQWRTWPPGLAISWPFFCLLSSIGLGRHMCHGCVPMYTQCSSHWPKSSRWQL